MAGMRWQAACGPLLLVVLLFALAATVAPPRRAAAFTQKGVWGGATPVGHEYLCVEAARQLGHLPELRSQRASDLTEILANNRAAFERLKDGRSKLAGKRDLAAEMKLVRQYSSDRSYQNLAALSAALGQRWVDTMGFSAVYYNTCFDNVAQLPNDIMPDHYMRRHQDVGAAGRAAAHEEGVRRLRAYFMAAVAAPSDLVPVVDASASQGHFLVLRDYFLLGRAFHLLQDSFSPEHTLRTGPRLDRVADLKHYGCLTETYQHSHDKPVIENRASNGDVIWKTARFSSKSPKNLSPTALAALAATKDLWIAYLAARRQPATATAHIDGVIAKWLQLAPTPAPPPSEDYRRERCPAGWKTTRELLDGERQDLVPARSKCLREYTGPSILHRDQPPYYWEHRKLEINRKVEEVFWGRGVRSFAVFVVTNVGGGSVWVGSEDVLRKKKTCHFEGGGLCDPGAAIVTYRMLSPELASFEEAAAEYCRHRTSEPRRVPLTRGDKATVYGESRWVTDAPNHLCPKDAAPPVSAEDQKYAVLLLTNVAGGSVVVARLGDIKQARTCSFHGGGLCDNSPPVQFTALSPLHDDRDAAVADYCRHRTTAPRRVPLTQGRKATVYGKEVWVSNAPSCPG